MTAVVKAAGLEMSNVVFVNPYLTADIPSRVMNERYAKRFEFGNTPGRATIQVSSLPGGAHIEYTGVAVRDLQQRKSIRPKNMPPSPTASPCVFAGDTLYCSAKSGFIPGPHGGVYATTTQHQAPADHAQSSRQPRRSWNGFQPSSVDHCLSGQSRRRVRFQRSLRTVFRRGHAGEHHVQQIAPTERKADQNDQSPDLEQVSLIAVRKPAH